MRLICAIAGNAAILHTRMNHGMLQKHEWVMPHLQMRLIHMNDVYRELIHINETNPNEWTLWTNAHEWD